LVLKFADVFFVLIRVHPRASVAHNVSITLPNSFLRKAIELAVANVDEGGGPFGAVVVKDGVIIATGVNRVTRANDPTAHAEVVAIREACRVLGDFQLSECELYSSCEPCPMCLGAIFWARPAHVYFAATAADAAAAGFDDSFIYNQIAVPHAERSIPMVQVADEHSTRPFERWVNRPDKTEY
jgi:guanine deaminase